MMHLNCSVMMMLLFTGVLLVAVMRQVSSQSPGAKILLSQQGLNYASGVALDILSKNIKSQKIPDQSGTANVAGKVEYTVSNVAIQSFTSPSSIVTINPGTGITWALSNAGIQANGNWAYKYKLWFIKISDHGTFDLTISGASASLSVAMGRDSNGRPTISVLGCSCTINTLKVKFHGGASWIYNLFSGFVEKPIKTALQKAVCEAATKTINNNGAQELATLKTSVTIENLFVIDYRLVENPLFASGYLQSSHKAEVFSVGDFTEAPFSASPISTTSPNRMLTVYLSEYAFNTLAHVLQKRGKLSYTLTKNDVPDNIKGWFATECPSGNCIGGMFPEVASQYPNSFAELNLRTTVSPSLAISANSATGTLKGLVTVIVRQSDGTVVGNLLTLGVSVTCTLTAGISGNFITATVTNFSPTVSVINSTLVNIPEESLNQLLEVASNAFIIPKLNQVGQKGFAIPSLDKVTLVGPSLGFIDGAVVVSTDVIYNP